MSSHATANPTADALRSAHPYLMYDHMHEQPDAIRDVRARNGHALAELARALGERAPVVLTGIGSSLHAAQLGEYWLRTLAGNRAARAIGAFELVNYFPPLEARAALIAISHRGWKQFASRSVRGAIEAGALTASICGEGARDGARAAQSLFITTAQEKSGAHTKSLTTAMALLLELAIDSAGLAGRSDSADALRPELDEIPARYERRLRDDSQERAAAERFRSFRRIVLIGAGPNCTSAREGALKLKEATFTYAEGFEVEEFLHGPIACADEQTLAILISAGGPGAERIEQAARALGEIGAARLALVNPDGAALASAADAAIHIEGAGEIPSPFGVILALQLFTYWSAIARGCDPDRNHREDPRQARAATHFKF
jgi:glutamine---fructose-6-phosphate transaminase (isomerizing)